jgi:hypothetical protein
MEQTMLMLIQKTKKLEQEVRRLQERETERQRIQELESIVTTLLQRLNMVEREQNYFRDGAGEAQRGNGPEPMEIEGNTP